MCMLVPIPQPDARRLHAVSIMERASVHSGMAFWPWQSYVPAMRKILADKYIRGHGIEIGGLHFPLPVPPEVTVTYVDRFQMDDPNREHADMTPAMKSVIVDDAEVLAKFQNASQDFLIANHVIEHCRDTLGTLKRWCDVVKPGGILYVAIPEKTQTFDRGRQITSLAHLICDNVEGPKRSDMEHYLDYFWKVDKLRHQAFADRVEAALKNQVNIHFHVWDLAAMQELFFHMESLRLIEVLECGNNGAEIIWVLRVSQQPQ